MNIVLEPGASALLDALHRAGFAAYAVGGCVRDSLLGLAPHDWDLCTAARPEQVMELFGEKQCIPTGLQHGTVTVKRDPEDRTTDALLRTLDFDFFEVLDSVTIARSRKHISKYYSTAEIGKFPEIIFIFRAFSTLR